MFVIRSKGALSIPLGHMRLVSGVSRVDGIRVWGILPA